MTKHFFVWIAFVIFVIGFLWIAYVVYQRLEPVPNVQWLPEENEENQPVKVTPPANEGESPKG